MRASERVGEATAAASQGEGEGHTVFCICIHTYGTCQKKLYEIRGLSASEIRRFSAASPRISAESCKGVRGIVQGCPRNRQWVSAES